MGRLHLDSSELHATPAFSGPQNRVLQSRGGQTMALLRDICYTGPVA